MDQSGRADIERVLKNLEEIRQREGLTARQVEQRQRLQIELERMDLK